MFGPRHSTNPAEIEHLKRYGLWTDCRAGMDGECFWKDCPQERDGEPRKSGRHCPLDKRGEEA